MPVSWLLQVGESFMHFTGIYGAMTREEGRKREATASRVMAAAFRPYLVFKKHARRAGADKVFYGSG